MDKLKPCPFCGNRDVRAILSRKEVGMVACYVCGGQVRYYGCKEEAIKIWNRRADK